MRSGLLFDLLKFDLAWISLIQIMIWYTHIHNLSDHTWTLSSLDVCHGLMCIRCMASGRQHAKFESYRLWGPFQHKLQIKNTEDRSEKHLTHCDTECFTGWCEFYLGKIKYGSFICLCECLGCFGLCLWVLCTMNCNKSVPEEWQIIIWMGHCDTADHNPWNCKFLHWLEVFISGFRSRRGT